MRLGEYREEEDEGGVGGGDWEEHMASSLTKQCHKLQVGTGELPRIPRGL